MAEMQPPAGPAVDTTLAAPLLMTKLFVPPTRPNLVRRQRLTGRLNEGLGRRLTLISAPAGFGKTTLLSEWIQPRTNGATSQVAIGWLSLDEGDNDPARFWSHFIAALQSVREGVGATALALLYSPQPPAITSILATFINEIAGASGELALVLDDYHLIETQAIHSALAYLLDHLPPQMHLIVSSRTDPPLSLARLRAREQLMELRADDLRFTPEEAAAFLERVLGPALSAEDVATLAARTEGWIAGLQLAVLSLQGREDVGRFIQAFSGHDRYILEYLVEEVLQRQPASVQNFLLDTSILDRLCAPLCDAVTGREDSQVMLAGLEAANLFTVALDSRQHWYRYHCLFADLLRHRLNQMVPERVGVLHSRACDWYERNGLRVEAVTHALAARDYERGGTLIEHFVRTNAIHSATDTLLHWLKALPDELVRSRPLLSLAYAWALLAADRPEAIEPRLRDAEAALQQAADDGETRRWLGHIEALRAGVASLNGDFAQAMELARRARQCLPEDDLPARSLVALSLGTAYAFGQQVDVPEATRAFNEAIAISQVVGNVNLALAAMTRLAGLHSRGGHLRQAGGAYRQALRLAAEQGCGPLPSLSEVHINFGELLREWHELEAAVEHLSEGIRLCKQGGRLVDLVHGYIFLARARQSQGDTNGALVTIQKARLLADGALEASQSAQQAENRAQTWLARLVAENQAWLWIAQGNFEAPARWAQQCGLEPGGALEAGTCAEYATLARLLTVQAKPGQALELLERLLAKSEAQGTAWNTIHLRTLQALAWQAQGDRAQALAVLECALMAAEPEGYVCTFVDRGEPMARLLREVRKRQLKELSEQRGTGGYTEAAAWAQWTLVAYVDKLLSAFSSGVSADSLAPSVPSAPSVLIEPLSERELEVLRLLAAGLSNREIAEELIVAIGTVKKHTHNIYGKLGVRSRTQAVLRAGELGLLSE